MSQTSIFPFQIPREEKQLKRKIQKKKNITSQNFVVKQSGEYDPGNDEEFLKDREQMELFNRKPLSVTQTEEDGCKRREPFQKREIQSRIGPVQRTGCLLRKHHDGHPDGDSSCCGSTCREMAGRLEGHVSEFFSS